MIRSKLHKLIQERVWLLAICSTSYLVLLIGLTTAAQPNFITLLIWSILFFCALEIILRLLLRFTYGQKYRYSLYNYFLIDDQVYGNRFRPNISTEAINFLVCDKYIFQFDQKIDNIDLVENKKQRVNFSINSRGFRGPEFSTQKTPGTIRIFCSGGSTTAGNWVDDDKTWPAFLEKFLREKGYRVEVINAGVQGWYSYQELLRFQTEIINYQPDLILLNQGINEEFAFSSQNLGRWWQPRVARHFMEEKYLFCPPSSFFSNIRFLLYFILMRTIFKNFIFDRKMPFTNPARWQCLRRPEYLAAWFDNLVDFARQAAKYKISIRSVTMPGLINLNDNPEERDRIIDSAGLPALKTNYLAASEKRNERVFAAASELIPVIDAAIAFRLANKKNSQSFFHDNIHFTVEGNRQFAETVGNSLLASGIFLSPTELKKENISLLTKTELRQLRRQATTNDKFLDEFIDQKIKALGD